MSLEVILLYMVSQIREEVISMTRRFFPVVNDMMLTLGWVNRDFKFEAAGTCSQ